MLCITNISYVFIKISYLDMKYHNSIFMKIMYFNTVMFLYTITHDQKFNVSIALLKLYHFSINC